MPHTTPDQQYPDLPLPLGVVEVCQWWDRPRPADAAHDFRRQAQDRRPRVHPLAGQVIRSSEKAVEAPTRQPSTASLSPRRCAAISQSLPATRDSRLATSRLEDSRRRAHPHA